MLRYASRLKTGIIAETLLVTAEIVTTDSALALRAGAWSPLAIPATLAKTAKISVRVC
jgi:hypothetical protein